MTLLRRLYLVPVRLWQVLCSSWMPPICRFNPSCSRYFCDAVEAHGILRGTAMGAWRILRCNPWCRGGRDPVPPAVDA